MMGLLYRRRVARATSGLPLIYRRPRVAKTIIFAGLRFQNPERTRNGRVDLLYVCERERDVAWILDHRSVAGFRAASFDMGRRKVSTRGAALISFRGFCKWISLVFSVVVVV